MYKSEKRLSNKITWHCICECGNEIDVRGECLRSGHTKTCGCSKAPKNLLGKKFNNLLVLEKTENRNPKGEIMWKCQCDCGRIILTNTSSLTSNKKKSIYLLLFLTIQPKT